MTIFEKHARKIVVNYFKYMNAAYSAAPPDDGDLVHDIDKAMQASLYLGFGAGFVIHIVILLLMLGVLAQ